MKKIVISYLAIAAIFGFLGFNKVTAEEPNPENAVFAILKLSYLTRMKNKDVTTEGGIMGTAFLIDDTTALTAHHVLHKDIGPPSVFETSQFWLLKRGRKIPPIPIRKDMLEYYPEIETTVINLAPLKLKTIPIKVSQYNTKVGDKAHSFGFNGVTMPEIEAKWKNGALVIKNYSLNDECIEDREGVILLKRLAVVNSDDVNLDKKMVVKPSFRAVKSMSGGPLLNEHNYLVGLMSFGLPKDATEKEDVFAIDVKEILQRLPRFNF